MTDRERSAQTSEGGGAALPEGEGAARSANTWEQRKAERKAWLAALKVGDRVAVASGFRCDKLAPAKVLKRTPSGQIVVRYPHGSEERFMPDGRHSRSTWDATEVRPWCREVEEILERDRLLQRLSSTRWHELGLDVLRAVAGALDAPPREPIPATPPPEHADAAPPTTSLPKAAR